MDQPQISKLLIPLPWLISAVLLIALLELCSGTDLYFVTMVTATLMCVGTTYNLLGGLSKASGMLFTAFAVRNIVISQIAKAFVFESATKNLEVPSLTITVYAVFYFCVMVGTYLWGRGRIRLPQPLEPDTSDSSRITYLLSLGLGTVGLVMYEVTTPGYGSKVQAASSSEHSLGVLLHPLLLFAMVLAVDNRIRKTEGRHSFGFAAFVPLAIAMADAFVDTVRTQIMMPVVVYFVACYLRSYKFRVRHYAGGILCAGVFALLISPVALYTRTLLNGESFSERMHLVYNVATTHSPVELAQVVADRFETQDYREQYFSRPGTYTLSRLSLIRADSTLINACSNGYHYGAAQLKEEIKLSTPSFLVKHKNALPETNYIGNVAGLGQDTTSQPILTVIADSYGAFGWAGVTLIAMLGFPAVFVLYDNMFDIRRPWGTVALGAALTLFGEMNVGRFIAILIRDPILILGFSYLIAYLMWIIPVMGDRRVSVPEWSRS
jgi:hypothetical protein